MMDAATWRERILSAIRDLADGAYQERVWVHGRGPEVDSGTEALCRLLDDYDFPGFVADAAARGWLSRSQLRALQRLATALEVYSGGKPDNHGDGARLASPEWQQVRRLAQETLDAFSEARVR